MTYTVRIEADDSWTLTDADGITVDSGSLPIETPGDIIDAILDDLGVGNPQREAFKTLFKQDWEIVDTR